MQPPSKFSKWQSRNSNLRSAHTKLNFFLENTLFQYYWSVCFLRHNRTWGQCSLTSFCLLLLLLPPSSKITILPSCFPFTWHSVMDPTCNPNQTSITRCGTRFLLVSVIHVSPPLPKNQITKKPSLRFLLVRPPRPQLPLFSHSNEGDLCNFKPRNDKKILKLKKKELAGKT